MGTTLLVWVLIVSTPNAPTVQLGDYSDLASCERVQAAVPTRHNFYESKCVQINRVYK